MLKYNPKYQLKHLSVRVPWHDNGWNGTICAEILQTNETEIHLLKSKLTKLKEQKKGLMKMLLTGKKRIKIK